MSATISQPAAGGWLRLLLRRQPHQVVETSRAPYLVRWFVLPRNRFLNVYLHKFIASDDPVAHDHPWWFASIVLSGRYVEHTAAGERLRRRGSVGLRPAAFRHTIELADGADGRAIPCWTLVVTGPKVRAWGFWCAGERFVR
ncbi:hypothetical protein [Mycobacterium sp. 29Ha]|uniref:hypothetical protein n=1 Tax=Mycobacterium sp. 29Ha TaxID=2939268 RepID=UPI00293921EE|nr:hypothetical protein [Mycobacterium sp. 29Ha]MDV3133333.1 hypothetical protein [Mycobacterium sp. 29Ha]